MFTSLLRREVKKRLTKKSKIFIMLLREADVRTIRRGNCKASVKKMIFRGPMGSCFFWAPKNHLFDASLVILCGSLPKIHIFYKSGSMALPGGAPIKHTFLTSCQRYVTNCINWSAAKVNTPNKRWHATLMCPRTLILQAPNSSFRRESVRSAVDRAL